MTYRIQQFDDNGDMLKATFVNSTKSTLSDYVGVVVSGLRNFLFCKLPQSGCKNKNLFGLLINAVWNLLVRDVSIAKAADELDPASPSFCPVGELQFLSKVG